MWVQGGMKRNTDVCSVVDCRDVRCLANGRLLAKRVNRGFPSRMVCLNYTSRVSNQNGVSQLYIEGFRPEWYISTIYQGFPTRMVYLKHNIWWRYTILDGNPRYHCKGTPFWSETLDIIVKIHHCGQKPSISL